MAGRPKGQEKFGGRKKGTPNKHTALIKDMIIQALDKAGGVDYLVGVAKDNPAAFCTLIGKVLPMNVTSEDGSMSPRVIKVVAASG
jgi:hypothetical protein